jgi:teichoic acid ribitol-phosphate primase
MAVLLTSRIWLIRVTYALARLFPLRERVVLAASNRSRIDGNLAAVRHELRLRNPPIPSIALAYRPPHGVLGASGTLLHDLRTTWYLATSRVFVLDDYCLPVYVVRRRHGTRVIRVGHAIGPSKRWGYGNPERTKSTSAALMREVQVHSNYDVCVLGSQRGIASYAEATRTPPDRFVTDIGIPRTDVLLDPDGHREALARVHAAYPQLSGRRVVLYAPTYRRVGRTAVHPESLDLALMSRRLQPNWVLAIRRHPGTRGPLRVPADARGFAVDVSDYPEVNELLLGVDVLVTDYSTVVYDFGLLGRPISFYTPDYEQVAQRQGFFIDFRGEEIGPTFTTTQQLVEWLSAGELNGEGARTFAKRWLDVADGHASQRFVDRLVVPALARDGASR